MEAPSPEGAMPCTSTAQPASARAGSPAGSLGRQQWLSLVVWGVPCALAGRFMGAALSAGGGHTLSRNRQALDVWKIF